jgi:uncharacterized membrane protein
MDSSVTTVVLSYAVTAGVFFAFDLVWLGWAAKGLYERHVGELLRDRVNWLAAVLFYAIYIGGIQMFVMLPAIAAGDGIWSTAVKGGMLGFFAYSTFDLTCLALVRGWSKTLTVIDIMWGTLLTGSTAAATLLLVRHLPFTV